MKDNYINLKKVLDDALNQASEGKGKERHANNDVFDKQPIMWIEEHFKSYQLGQAVKKMHESQSLPLLRGIAELLGAINYIAAHIIFLKLGEVKQTLYEKHKLTKKEIKVAALTGRLDATGSSKDILNNLKDIVNPEFVDG